jgi:hypothetical protein
MSPTAQNLHFCMRSISTAIFRVLLTVLFLSSSLRSQAQLSYTFAQTSETYVPLSTFTTLATASSTTGATALDNVSYALPAGSIPFPFYFNGSGYSTVSVSTNGFLTFGGTPSGTNVNPLGSTAVGGGSNGYFGAAVAFGRDLIGVFNASNPANPDTIANIRYGVTGVAPDRKFVVEWNNFRPSGSGGSALAVINFQIRLTESTGICEIAYGSFASTTWVNSTAQVGLRGASNTVFFNRSLASGQPWTNTSQGATATSTCAYTATALPGNGLVYRFIANCPSPNNLSILDLTASSVRLRWNSGSVEGTFPGASYSVEWGLSGFTPGTGTIVNTNDTFLLLNGLTAGTAYQYYVQRNCSASGNGISVKAGPKTFTPGLLAEDCADAQLISVAANQAACASTTVTSGSSQNGPNALCSDALGGNFPDDDKWFKFVAPSSGNEIVITTTAGTINDWVMEVWTACPTGNASSYSCSDDANGGMPELRLCQNEFVAGQTIYVRVWTYSLNASGTMGLCVYEAAPCPIPPAYDDCISAETFTINPVLSCPAGAQVFTTLFATPSVGGDNTADDPSCDASASLNDVWLRFNTGTSGTFNVNFGLLTATDLRAQLVFECGGGGYELDCWNPAVGTHTISGLNPSANYAIRVWSAPGQAGTFTVCAQDACDDATATLSGSSTICTTGVAQLRVDLTGVPPWNVTYTNGVTNSSFTTSTTPYFINVSPTVTTFYNLVSVSSPICNGTVNGVASVNVVQPPVVNLNNFTTPVCSNQTVTLSGGTPVGGAYSGPGVSGNQFNASIAGVGSHPIVYIFGIGNGCQRSDTAFIQVIQAPSISSFTPAVAPVGSTVKVLGSHLTTVNNVRFNQTNASVFTLLSADSLTAVVPVGATTGFITVTRANGCTASSPTTFGVGTPAGVSLNVRALVEGYYLGGGTMNAVVDPVTLAGKSDTLILELHTSTAPYSLVAIRSVLVNTDGTMNVSFPASQVANSYYLVLKGRNMVETWSKNPVTFISGINAFDFTVPGNSVLRVMHPALNGSARDLNLPSHPE